MKRVQVGGNRKGQPQAWALVDDEDFEALSAYRWHSHGGYAGRNSRLPDGRKCILLMHREILGLHRGNANQGDHINRNRLDNRRANLRVVTIEQQRQNVSAYGKSGIRGVDLRDGYWRARCHGRYLGIFRTAEEAEIAVKAYRAQHVPYSEEAASV